MTVTEQTHTFRRDGASRVIHNLGTDLPPKLTVVHQITGPGGSFEVWRVPYGTARAGWYDGRSMGRITCTSYRWLVQVFPAVGGRMAFTCDFERIAGEGWRQAERECLREATRRAYAVPQGAQP